MSRTSKVHDPLLAVFYAEEAIALSRRQTRFGVCAGCRLHKPVKLAFAYSRGNEYFFDDLCSDCLSPTRMPVQVTVAAVRNIS